MMQSILRVTLEEDAYVGFEGARTQLKLLYITIIERSGGGL